MYQKYFVKLASEERTYMRQLFHLFYKYWIVGDGKWLKYINMIDIQINLAIMNIEKKKFSYRRRYLWS